MMYKCNSCDKEFDIPAWLSYNPVIHIPVQPTMFPTGVGYPGRNWPYTAGPQFIGSNAQYQIPVCPFCYSKEIEANKND